MQRLHRNRPVEMQWLPDVYSNCRQEQQSSIFTDSKIRELKQVEKDVFIKTKTLRQGAGHESFSVLRQMKNGLYGELCPTLLPSTTNLNMSITIFPYCGRKESPYFFFTKNYQLRANDLVSTPNIQPSMPGEQSKQFLWASTVLVFICKAALKFLK